MFELRIVDTIAKVVDTNQINLQVILAGVIAAIIWNLITWYLGIPSSLYPIPLSADLPETQLPLQDGMSCIPEKLSKVDL